MEAKTQLKELKSARFVTSKFKELSAVIIKKNKMIEQGVDMMIFEHKDQWYIGNTLAVQDFEQFSKRDYDRPAHDTVSGMLPPKLSRMMINLAGKELSESVLLDAFCGSGTVLMEALTLGAQKIYGSDISSKAIEDSLQNINWLKEELNKDTQVKIEQVDAQDLSVWLPSQSIDLIVSEPFLGEPLRSMPSASDIQKRQHKLSRLYEQVFAQFYEVLKDDGVIVFIFPFVKNVRIPFFSALKSKWEIIQPLQPYGFEYERGGVDYQRPNQFVGREILILKKKK